jgi:hypothetical protein
MHVTKDEAIKRLRDAGYSHEANELEEWRDKNGKNWGWDGWIKKEHKQLKEIIWPD